MCDGREKSVEISMKPVLSHARGSLCRELGPLTIPKEFLKHELRDEIEKS